MKQKFVLSADSHALSAFQRCPEEHHLSYVQHLETAQPKDFYDKGTLVHLMLGLYYKLRRRGFDAGQAGMLVATKRFNRWKQTFKIEPDDEKHILARFFEYVSYYQAEVVKPVGIEVGFSEKLFEDKNFIFIYEGRVDLIGFEHVKNEGMVLHFTDHKTRSAAYSLDYYKNQFFGYAWMMKKVYGSEYKLWGKVNYFGLQADKTGKLNKEGKLFEKVWFQFTDNQLKQWEQDTISWFGRMAQARMFNLFPRSWQCDRQFGECAFKKYCKQPTKWEKDLILIGNNYFKKREKEWSAWE